MAKLVSRTYGDALFELAVEENRVDELSEEIQVLTEILEQNKDFEKIMVHPEIPQMCIRDRRRRSRRFR